MGQIAIIGNAQDAQSRTMLRKLIEAESAGIPRQVAAPISCEARGRINAERLSREMNEDLEALADEGGD